MCATDKTVECEEAMEKLIGLGEELLDDQQWKLLQQNTFTRWASEKLKAAGKQIADLGCDLSDGLRLIDLIEVLSQKQLPKHNKKPIFRSQKLENVSVALKFLDDEGIRIVNIDSSDIVDGKLKLILGLIWTLILHYSISMPKWEGEDDKQYAPPKERLMQWIQSKLPDLLITNFTSQWNDGRAVGALVDAVAPGLCPDWQDWDAKDALQNASEAMGLADDWLNVPQLIKPEEMVAPNVDEMSMMTYLSQYHNAELQSGAPLRSRTNRNRVRVYGTGIEPSGPIAGVPVNFTVKTFSAGKGNVDVIVEEPDGNKIPVDIVFNKDKNLAYTVSYTPQNRGPHRIKILFAGREIPKSPYVVNVEAQAGDSKKVTVSGPGIQSEGVLVNRPTFFDIFTKDAGLGIPEVAILDPQDSRTTIPVKLRRTLPDVWRCEYTSPATGLHFVNVSFAGNLIPGSPHSVNVALPSDAKKCRAYGRGLLPNRVRVQDDADFVIVTKGAGDDVPAVEVVGPDGVNPPVHMSKIDQKAYECHYTPMKEGRHVVTITYGGKEISKSPFEVKVGPYKESAIRAFGSGLYGGVVGYPAKFTVETNDETDGLMFSIDGPSKAKINCNANGNGTVDVSYLPTAPGHYAVHMLRDGEDVPKSPYVVKILPKGAFDPDKVEVYGPGVQAKCVASNEPTEFTVDVRKAGQAALEVAVQDALGRDVPVRLDDSRDGKVQCQYTPTDGSQHVVMVNYGGVATKESPYRLQVEAALNPAKVLAYGPGLENGVKSNIPTYFNVDCSEAGPGELRVSVENSEEREISYSLTDNEDGTYNVNYLAPQPGTYLVNLNYGGLTVPQCPIQVNVQPSIDVSKIKVHGLARTVCVNRETEFTIDAGGIATSENHDDKVICTINTPSGGRIEKLVVPGGDGIYHVIYIPCEEGCYTIDILYHDIPVPGSPFSVNVERIGDPTKCRAYGPGLKQGYVNKHNKFVVETKDGGNGGLDLSMEGPGEVKVACKDNYDGSCDVEYVPTKPGDCQVSIKFAKQHIPGSPFRISVVNAREASKVSAYGPGLEVVRVNVPAKFIVDTLKCGPGQLDIILKTDKGQVQKPIIERRENGLYEVTYQPPPAGSNLQVGVTYDGENIPGSPFKPKVLPTVEPSEVSLSGLAVAPVFPASFPVDFIVDTSKAGYGYLEIQVLGPDQVFRKVEIEDLGDGKYKATYLPDDCGCYKVRVKYGGADVLNCPINVQSISTGKAEKCKIKEGIQQTLAEGEEYCITVDTENAGCGAVTCCIRSTSGSEVADIDIEDNGDGTVSIYYTVADPGEYTVSIKFGGLPVPEGCYTFRASEEYREHSTHRSHRAGRSRQKKEQCVVENYSTSIQETSSAAMEKFEVIRLNNIPLSLPSGTVT
ncbi:filamin-A-like isoform X2 [Andrena cerasifolii]